MRVTLANLARGSGNFTLHQERLMSTFLAGASSRFWHGQDWNARGLGAVRIQKIQEAGYGSRGAPCENLQTFFLLNKPGCPCYCREGMNALRSKNPEKVWNRYCSSGTLIPRHSRFAIRASTGGSLAKKGGSKTKLQFVCENCGETFSQWWGACKNCKEMNTLKEFRENVQSAGPRGGAAARAVERVSVPSKKTLGSLDADDSGRGKGTWFLNDDIGPQRLPDVAKGFSNQHWRLTLPGVGGSEVSRVLGGGIVPGSLILVGGDPGVGKSTLLLQIAEMLAVGSETLDPAPVLYVSGEESVEQISNRADRMKIAANELFLYSATDLEVLLAFMPMVERSSMP